MAAPDDECFASLEGNFSGFGCTMEAQTTVNNSTQCGLFIGEYKKYTLSVVIFSFNWVNGISPDYLRNDFKYTSDTRNYKIRTRDLERLPHLRNLKFHRPFRYHEAKTLNTLPRELKFVISLSELKNILVHFFSNP